MVIRELELRSWVSWEELAAWEICLVMRGVGMASAEEELGEVGSIDEEVTRVTADSLPLDGQIEWDGVLGGRRLAAREVEVLLEVGGFDVDGGVEISMIQVHIDVQKRNLGRGGGMPSDFYGDSSH